MRVLVIGGYSPSIGILLQASAASAGCVLVDDVAGDSKPPKRKLTIFERPFDEAKALKVAATEFSSLQPRILKLDLKRKNPEPFYRGLRRYPRRYR